MDSVSQYFEERLQEIESYLDLLDALELELKGGQPRLGDTIITTQQQRILYSSVFLQLYNLVEATLTWCIEAVRFAATDHGRWQAGDLIDGLRREWVRSIARTHIDHLTPEHRLDSAFKLCDHMIQALPLLELTIESRANVDDFVIESVSQRLGVRLTVSKDVYQGIKRPFRDDKGPLVLVKDLRNQLAHGSLSFSECGDGVTAPDLRNLKQRTANYLREVITGFAVYVDGHEFLVPLRRP